jgi:hypothetical protein
VGRVDSSKAGRVIISKNNWFSPKVQFGTNLLNTVTPKIVVVISMFIYMTILFELSTRIKGASDTPLRPQKVLVGRFS